MAQKKKAKGTSEGSPEGSAHVSLHNIKKTVAFFFGLKPRHLDGKRRTKTIALARGFAMYLAQELTDMTYPQLGELFGNKTHSGAIAAVNRIEGLVSQDVVLRWVARKEPKEFRASEVLETLRQRILQGAPEVVGTQQSGRVDGIHQIHHLPAPPGDFVGREGELEELLTKVKVGGATISCLRGMGGVGKTALALVLGDELKKHYPDAQFFVNLKGTNDEADPDDPPLTPAQAMGRVIQGYFPDAKLPEDESQLASIYRSVLDGKRAIVFADNAKDADQVRPLIPPDSCLLMVTSRNTFALPGLHSMRLDTLSPADAEELLLKIEPRIGDHAERIAKLCGYLPLALRAAASMLQVRTDLQPADYVEQLSNEQDRLKELGTEGVEIGVEASLNLSYRNLSDETKRGFRLAGVFPDTFDSHAAERICDDSERERITELIRYNLVEYDAESRRYHPHDLLRIFARAKLTPDERHKAHLAHAEHYGRILGLANDLYLKGGEGVLKGLRVFDTERGNIEAGQRWSATNAETDDDAAKLSNDYPDAGAYVLSLRLHPRKRIAWLEQGVRAARKLNDRTAEGHHLGNLGIAFSHLGETRKAIECHEKALEIDREIGDRRGEGAVLGNLGLAFADLGETRKAIEYHEKALEIGRKIGDRRAEGQDLGNLGLAFADLGETRKAIEYYEKQLKITREIGDRRGEGNALGNLGLAFSHLGETRKAIEYYEKDLEIAREIGDARGEGTGLWNMALAWGKLGEREKAISLAEGALEIRERIEDPNAEKVREALEQWRGEDG